MTKKLLMTVGLVLGLSMLLASVAFAGIPFRPFSTCTVSIVQTGVRSQCINNFNPDVVRLTPEGSTASPAMDRVTFTLKILDALAQPVNGALISVYEQTEVVNISNGGSTTATTNASGSASVSLHAAGGYGLVSVCADGVAICEVEIRSPDVNKGTLPSACVIPTTGATSVAGADITNGTCGFIAKFGVVTPGVNNAWDLNCDNSVSGVDITGTKGNSGVLPFFGDVGTPGAKSTCP
jgi:hypothetical protein